MSLSLSALIISLQMPVVTLMKEIAHIVNTSHPNLREVPERMQLAIEGTVRAAQQVRLAELLYVITVIHWQFYLDTFACECVADRGRRQRSYSSTSFIFAFIKWCEGNSFSTYCVVMVFWGCFKAFSSTCPPRHVHGWVQFCIVSSLVLFCNYLCLIWKREVL